MKEQLTFTQILWGFRMDMMLPDWFCRLYGKRYGIFVPSGMLAIESALRLLNPPLGSGVLIPSNACWKIGYAVRRAGLYPVFLDVGENLVIRAYEIKKAIEALSEQPIAELGSTSNTVEGISVCIAVHHLGLPVNVGHIRQILPNRISIIEDYAQAWRLLSGGESVGIHSDVVVTSFGASKPLSLGFGGAVFCNELERLKIFDLSRQVQFVRQNQPIPYALPCPAIEELNRATDIADASLYSRKHFASTVEQSLGANSGSELWSKAQGDQPTWCRIPILFNTFANMQYFIRCAHYVGLTYQIPHETEPYEIPFIGGIRISLAVETCRKLYVLLYPDPENEKRWENFVDSFFG